MIIARDQLPTDTPPTRLPGFAVRGIGKHGLDVHCQTVAAASAPHALMHVFQFHPAAAQDAVAWVVTRLP
jgi:hypothetical protein